MSDPFPYSDVSWPKLKSLYEYQDFLLTHYGPGNVFEFRAKVEFREKGGRIRYIQEEEKDCVWHLKLILPQVLLLPSDLVTLLQIELFRRFLDNV